MQNPPFDYRSAQEDAIRAVADAARERMVEIARSNAADPRAQSDDYWRAQQDCRVTHLRLAIELLEPAQYPQHTGYICKRCGHPSPLGVGYADSRPGAYLASCHLTQCDCGYSHLPESPAH